MIPDEIKPLDLLGTNSLYLRFTYEEAAAQND